MAEKLDDKIKSDYFFSHFSSGDRRGESRFAGRYFIPWFWFILPRSREGKSRSTRARRKNWLLCPIWATQSEQRFRICRTKSTTSTRRVVKPAMLSTLREKQPLKTRKIYTMQLCGGCWAGSLWWTRKLKEQSIRTKKTIIKSRPWLCRDTVTELRSMVR